ncbi:MerR family transcriptional regulator [Actinoplanes sp. HUAS TT8]|uniref:MerR family transcriptional regulator n=1 Tax=Actinoplanes sp. HUAS TT8 TaxID=3447453 RepID=UPI003F5259C2
MADEALSAGAAARRLGVAVTTLRTWHQRYGLGPSRHESGHHRRYTADDMDRLQVMQSLTAQGVAPAEAAAWALAQPSPDATAAAPAEPPSPSAGPDPETAARGLTRAAMRLDAPAMRDILCTAIRERGVVTAWADVIAPVLVAIGDRYELTQRFIEVEHLLSRTVTEVLASVQHAAGTPRILLAAADEEQHTLPLEALAAALAQGGVPTRQLGARVPSQALLDAIGRTGPSAVVLWSQRPATGDVGQLTRVRDVPHPPVVVAAGGPGWPQGDLPTGITRLTGLADAVQLLTPV